MEDMLRKHIENLFEDAAPTGKTIELKEEMLQNLQDKYRDLIAEGKSPEAAFNVAVASIGDVNVLLRQLEDGFLSGPEREKLENARQKSAMLTAVAVMMYILCVLPLVILTLLNIPGAYIVGIPLMFGMVAVATGLLIYNSMTKPKHYKESDTMVEEFREWQSDNHGRNQMRKAISSALWSLIVVAYIIISFTTGAWHISWVIFVAGGAIESFINIIYAARNKGG